uniref:Uncharacterized protein n=1 Tax=Aegilops tauschii subsp. strangulata TaxID=200361 RepID=A0A453DWU1_AEGTS
PHPRFAIVHCQAKADGSVSSHSKMAAREWVRWEEEILLEDDDEHHKECFYLCCAPPQGGGVSERDLAVVGKYWPLPAGNIVYSADVQFLRSLEEAIICGSASAR